MSKRLLYGILSFRRLVIENGGRKFKSPQNNRGPLGYRSAKSPYARKGRMLIKQVKARLLRIQEIAESTILSLAFLGLLPSVLAEVFRTKKYGLADPYFYLL